MFNKLKGRIREVAGSDKAFAEKVGMHPVLIGRKLNGQTTWKREDILKAVKALEIKREEIPSYFFDEKDD